MYNYIPSETKSPRFTGLVRLFFTGKPIEQKYSLNITEKAYKEKLQNKITREKPITPFSNNNKAFYAYMYEDYGRKFFLQSNRTADNKRILNHFIDIHAEIHPVDEKNIDLPVSFHRNERLKFSHLVVGVSLLIMEILGIRLALKNGHPTDILLISGVLIFFYLAFVLMIINSMQKEIKSALADLEIDSYSFHPILNEKVFWHPDKEKKGIFITDAYPESDCFLKMNDFPDEPMWTLYCRGEKIDFDDEPAYWTIQYRTK